MFESLFDIDPAAGEAELRAVVERCEQLKSAAAAAQARATALWADKRRAAEAAAGVPSVSRGKGLATEVALARHDAPALGGRHLGFARALVTEMPHTLAALEAGVLSEWRATLIVRESACLSVEHRRQLDAELCADAAR
ncbi:MAG: HNH endonuclease, partial [Actinomycetota bacterium]|nr:HNH endonuclease [Actinomycetota bacterium]